MINIYVVVEGNSEEKFINDILSEYFANKSIFIQAEKVITGKNSVGKICKGGGNSYKYYKNHLQKRVKQFSKQKNFFFTTMIDYYAIPKDFPKLEKSDKITNIYDKIDFLEKSFYEDIGYENFIPNIQLHEFETLCFADIEAIKEEFFDINISLDIIKKDIEKYDNIELINKKNPPSKRLNIYTNGQYCQAKVSKSFKILKKIGVENIRQKCKHFNNWLKRIEGIANV